MRSKVVHGSKSMTWANRVIPVFIGACQRARLARHRIRLFDVKIVDASEHAQLIAATLVFAIPLKLTGHR